MEVSLAKSDQAPLRLLWVSTELRTGGAERCLVNLATELEQHHCRSVVVSLAPLPNQRLELVEQLSTAQIPTHSLQARHAWELPSVTKQLARLIDQYRPDAIVSFLFHANLCVWRARKRAAAHSAWIANLRVSDPRRWRMWLERKAYREADRVICVSQDVAQVYRRRVVAAEKLSVIPNGVDLKEVDRQRANSKTPAVQADVAIVGRLHPQKGIDALLRAWADAPESCRKLRLAVLGEGPARDQLQQLARSLNLAPQIQWLEWQSEPWSCLREVPIVLLPSRFEGMANVMLEAMGAGKVVLATDVQGVSDVLPVEASSGGLVAERRSTRWQVVPVGGWMAIWEKAAQVLADQQLTIWLQRANRERISAGFTWQSTLESFEKTIRESI